MRTTLSVLSLCACLFGCDFPKSAGEDETTTGGDTVSGSGVADTEGSSSVSGYPGNSGSGPYPGTASATVTSGGAATTGAAECPGFDPGPSDDPNSEYMWECWCTTCTLTYEDIPYETLMQFDPGGLCDCLCEANNCGEVEGEGGVTGSAESGDIATDSATTGWNDTEGGTTTGASPLTYDACVEQGGVIVGDMGDGAVFEPDYVCPGGESPIGILDFEPGMPFPKNGGVCCPPEA